MRRRQFAGLAGSTGLYILAGGTAPRLGAAENTKVGAAAFIESEGVQHGMVLFFANEDVSGGVVS
jgi:hypothetical protein